MGRGIIFLIFVLLLLNFNLISSDMLYINSGGSSDIIINSGTNLEDFFNDDTQTSITVVTQVGGVNINKTITKPTPTKPIPNTFLGKLRMYLMLYLMFIIVISVLIICFICIFFYKRRRKKDEKEI